MTVKRPPISMASLPVAMNSSLRAAALNASRSGELPLGEVAVLRLAHRRAEDGPVPERCAGNLPAELGVTLVALGIGRVVVENDCSDHRA